MFGGCRRVKGASTGAAGRLQRSAANCSDQLQRSDRDGRGIAEQLGTLGAWFNPVYEDAARVKFVVEAEALGYTTAWLGMGRQSVAYLGIVEQALDASSSARSSSVRSTSQRLRIPGALHRRRNASMPAGLPSVNYPEVIH
jgi:hypothetical protein